MTLVFLRGCAGLEGWADTDAVTPTPAIQRHHHRKVTADSTVTPTSRIYKNSPANPLVGFTPTIGATASEESPAGPPKQ